MKKRGVLLTILQCLLFYSITIGQNVSIDRTSFFMKEDIIECTLLTDIKNLISAKKDLNYIPADITFIFPDSTKVKEEIQVKPRGHFRKEQCYLASLQLDFKNPSSPILSPLKKLKLTGGCGKTTNDEQLLLKEYLVYKLYSLITDFSFRVRLLHINYEDSRGKVKPYTQYAFLTEDVDEMAKRNNCQEKEKLKYQYEEAQKYQTTLLAIFQYMIGNIDWDIPTYHNIKLLVNKSDTLTAPYPVPFDFDLTGIVNANYAIPPEDSGIKFVTDRLYMGHKVTPDELNKIISVFLDKEKDILNTVKDFKLLNEKSSKQVIKYLNDFFDTIHDEKQIIKTFITEAKDDKL